MAAQPSGVSTSPPGFVSSANLLRVHSNSSSRSSMKKLNKTVQEDPHRLGLQDVGQPALGLGAVQGGSEAAACGAPLVFSCPWEQEL